MNIRGPAKNAGMFKVLYANRNILNMKTKAVFYEPFVKLLVKLLRRFV